MDVNKLPEEWKPVAEALLLGGRCKDACQIAINQMLNIVLVLPEAEEMVVHTIKLMKEVLDK